MSEITTEEWLSELARIDGENDEGLTVRELANVAGVNRGTMRDRLVVGVNDGRYVSGWARKPDGAGRIVRQRVYRVAK